MYTHVRQIIVRHVTTNTLLLIRIQYESDFPRLRKDCCGRECTIPPALKTHMINKHHIQNKLINFDMISPAFGRLADDCVYPPRTTDIPSPSHFSPLTDGAFEITSRALWLVLVELRSLPCSSKATTN